jgi:hypothetical protein
MEVILCKILHLPDRQASCTMYNVWGHNAYNFRHTIYNLEEKSGSSALHLFGIIIIPSPEAIPELY